MELKRDAGQTFSFDEIKAAVEKHKPAAVFLCQVTAQHSWCLNALVEQTLPLTQVPQE